MIKKIYIRSFKLIIDYFKHHFNLYLMFVVLENHHSYLTNNSITIRQPVKTLLMITYEN